MNSRHHTTCTAINSILVQVFFFVEICDAIDSPYHLQRIVNEAHASIHLLTALDPSLRNPDSNDSSRVSTGSEAF